MSNGAAAIDTAAWTIVEEHDTRDIEERGDRFVRVTGSGHARACDHCGATHEIHVTVRNWKTGEEMTVGGRCARGLARNGARKTYRIPEPALMARGPGWKLFRILGTDTYRLTGRNADHPKVIAMVARNYGEIVA